MNRPQFIRRLQFGKGEYEEMLAHMDASGAGKKAIEGGDGSEGRVRDRFEYPVADLPLSIEHPEGGTSRFLVFGRNISRTGIAVLHGGFVYPGSACQVILGEGDERRAVRGEVVHCRLFAGSCHEIGIRFLEEIDIERLTRPPARPDETAADDATGFRRISGTILYAEAFPPDRALLEHQLSLFGLDLETVTTTGAVLDKVKKDPPGLILYGLSLGDENALEAIKEVRESGYDGPLLVLTAENDPKILDRARENGATDVIAKPYYLDLLVAQLEAFLSDAPPSGAVHSTMADQSGMPPLIADYAQLVRRMGDQIDKACAEQDWHALRTCCNQLKGSGCSYGFQNLTVAAIAVLNALGEDGVDAEGATKVAVLAGICRSLEFHQREDAA